ncbi:MAG: nickel pincer cofactor biosynthesis protein LarB [Methanobacteriaceae archaeon]|nr:nickel pincer cofactor biosynthesis protein LarB [Methanobacteriaceae archaeon]
MQEILNLLLNKKISIEEAEKELKAYNIQEITNNIKLDQNREVRAGVPEAIYAEGKTNTDLINLINNINFKKQVLITKLDQEKYEQIKDKLDIPDNINVDYYNKAKILTLKKEDNIKLGKIGIITAGTSDIPIAEEARITAQLAGIEVIYSYDVGVSGIHRLFDQMKVMIDEEVQTIIVLAGMEGALPSVVAGLIDVPIIAVPTSTGYGVGQKGFVALFSMLQSCAPGLSVVNIDNGYGAAVNSIILLKQINKKK